MVTVSQFNALPDAPPLPTGWTGTVDEYVMELFNHCDALMQQKVNGQYSHGDQERAAYRFKLVWPYLNLILYCDLRRKYRVKFAIPSGTAGLNANLEIDEYRYIAQPVAVDNTYTGGISTPRTSTVIPIGQFNFGERINVEYISSTHPLQLVIQSSDGEAYNEGYYPDDAPKLVHEYCYNSAAQYTITIKPYPYGSTNIISAYELRVSSEVVELSAIATRVETHSNVYRHIYKIPAGANRIEITAGETPRSSLYDADGNELRSINSRSFAINPGEEWIAFEFSQYTVYYFEVRAS